MYNLSGDWELWHNEKDSGMMEGLPSREWSSGSRSLLSARLPRAGMASKLRWRRLSSLAWSLRGMTSFTGFYPDLQEQKFFAWLVMAVEQSDFGGVSLEWSVREFSQLYPLPTETLRRWVMKATRPGGRLRMVDGFVSFAPGG